jgi:dTDP-4-dehydrorhamnose reductase
MLGTTLAPVLTAAGHDVVRHAHRGAGDVSCDLTDREAVRAMIEAVRPEAVVNLVAWTNVDNCERDPHGAYLLNVRPVEALVDGLRGRDGAFLVQISTDHVYDAAGPSREDDIKLTNTYALTKYAGELAAKIMPSTVLRTNFFGASKAPGRRSFSDWVLDSLKSGTPITGLSDVIVNPLSMGTLSRMIGRVLERRVAGVFNLGSRGAMSKADFIVEVARAYGAPADTIKRGLSVDAGLAVYRPKDMSMDCGRFEVAFGVMLPQFKDEIASLARNSDVAVQ